MREQMFMRLGFLCLVLTTCWGVYAHDDEHENKKAKIEYSTAKLAKINQLYLAQVQPIFRQKCFDCHSDIIRYPWYYKVPGIKYLMDSDIEEGLEYMDLGKAFPFGREGDADHDLEEIEEVLKENEMPPWQYMMMHWKSGLTEDEKWEIISWVRQSEEILKQKAKN